MTTADTAILIPAREKLGLVHECLDAVFAHTGGSFHVYLVEAGYPPPLLAELEARAAGTTNLTLVRGEPPILANAGFNLALAASHEPFVCVIENDVIARPGYWAPLREVLQETDCDLVSPTINDGRSRKIHFDPPVSTIVRLDDGFQSDIVRRPKPDWPRVEGRRRVYHLEKHCFAGTRDAMIRLYPLDEVVCTRTDIDLSLTAFAAELQIWMCPEAEVTFYGPPLAEVDHEFFAHRWDIDRAAASNEHLVAKWNLKNDVDYLHFVREMHEFL